MYLIAMRPEEIHDAVSRNVPVLFSVGAVEYHGPHLPIGTDFLISESILPEIEKKCECVIAPSIPFSPTMSWAGAPQDGEIDFDPDALYHYAKAELKGLMDMGFRRIYVHQFHQGPEGLPCVTLKRAALDCIRETGQSWGCGWGQKDPEELPNPNIFSWIKIVPDIDAFSEYPSANSPRIPMGHGGKGETQMVMAQHPEMVRLEALQSLQKRPPWLEDAEEASEAEGRRWLSFCVDGWVRELSRDTLPPKNSERRRDGKTQYPSVS